MHNTGALINENAFYVSYYDRWFSFNNNIVTEGYGDGNLSKVNVNYYNC